MLYKKHSSTSVNSEFIWIKWSFSSFRRVLVGFRSGQYLPFGRFTASNFITQPNYRFVSSVGSKIGVDCGDVKGFTFLCIPWIVSWTALPSSSHCDSLSWRNSFLGTLYWSRGHGFKCLKNFRSLCKDLIIWWGFG